MILPVGSFRRLAALFVWAASTVAGGAEQAGASPLAANPRYSGTPFMRTWLAEDYGAHPMNHSLLQHPRTGLIYVGNNSGVLEFDGERWRLIPLPDNSAARGLSVDARGRIWACSATGLFRLEPDERGTLQARSMRERMQATAKLTADFHGCVATSRGIYAQDRLRLWFLPVDDGPAQVWRLSKTNATLLALWVEDDEPHVLLGERPIVIVRLHEDRLERLGTPPLRVLAMRTEPGASKHYLANDRLSTRRAESVEDRRYPFKAEAIQAAAFLADGRIVLGTVGDGVLLADRDHRLLQRIDRRAGLPANSVKAVMEDREGGVWLALSYGLARLQLDSPDARHGPAQGLEGTVQSLARHDGRLFAAGTEGLFVRGLGGRFDAVSGARHNQTKLLDTGEWLLSLSTQLVGLRQGGDAKPRSIEERTHYDVLPLVGQRGWYAFGANDGVRWARFEEDRWISKGPARAFREPSRPLLEAPAGVVWATSADKLWQLDLRAGLSQNAPARQFGPEQGVSKPPTSMFVLGGEILAACDGRLLRFDLPSDRFVPETRIAGFDSLGVERSYVDHSGIVWLQGPPPDRQIHRLLPDVAERWRTEALPGEALRHLQPATHFHDPATQTFWIGGHGALISRDLTWQPANSPKPPAAMVRRIETGTGELLGASSDPAVGPMPGRLGPDTTSLRISFAAPTYASDHDGVVHTEYRTRLDGLDREWTAWSRRTDRDFTNLAWRDFMFRVQARDDAGRIGSEATIALAIVPPWWAARWAWTGYGALGLLGVAGVVQLRTRALRRRAEQLEAIVAARTRELAASNAELARLNQLELDEKIAAQLSEEKARLEVLRYQLNPHFLYNSLNSIYGLLFGNPRDAGEMVLRLSDFCRATLTGPKDELPTLEAEIGALRSYLDVEQAGWGDKLRVEFTIASEATPARLPPFLLLPLVENAVKYGHRTTREVLHLKISARRADGVLHLEIANSGAWVPPNSLRPNSTGIGLENLRQRLRRYYPQAHEFTTEEKDGFVTARLRLVEAGLKTGPVAPGRNQSSG